MKFGRRRSDRWLAYTAIVLMIILAAFVIFTSYQQTQGERDRAAIVNKLDAQNQDLLCFADNTQLFEIAVADYLLVSQRDPSSNAEISAAIRDLHNATERLRIAKVLCVDSSSPASPATTPP